MPGEQHVMKEGNTMGKNTACYLCGSANILDRPGSLPNNSDLSICECASCGLVFLSSFDHIKENYYENSEMHGDEPLDIQEWLQEVEWDDDRRFNYLKSLLPKRSVLDFGCGAAGFLSKARNLASKVFGVEIESRLHSHFRRQGLTVFKNMGELPEDMKYDIITLFHVIEHHPDPKVLLTGLKERLDGNGQIIVEVPNADDALLTLYRCEPFTHFTYREDHLYFYSKKTLEMLALQSGLKVKYIKQVQRYPLSNHLHWLAKGKPGGHQLWHFLDTPGLNFAYEAQLAGIGKCDTILASFSAGYLE